MVRRWPALIVITALLVGGGIVNRGHTSRQTAKRVAGGIPLDDPAGAPQAVAAPQGALSSTWYCGAGTAVPGGVADMFVVVANPGPRALATEVTVVSDSGQTRTRQIVAPARGRVSVSVQRVLTAEHVAALVEVRGGGVSVDRELAGPLGSAIAPCATRSSDHWYFAAGSTLRGADEYLSLFNPYPDDSTVDMTFDTEQGERAPRALQGFPVPGRSVRVVHLNTQSLNRHAPIAARLVARSGRLIVDRLQAFDGTGDPVGAGSAEVAQTAAPKGLAVSAGATRPATYWAFPTGGKAPGEREQIVVSNPTNRDAAAQIGITLDDPARNGELDPIALTVPAHDVKVFDVTDQATVPESVAHSITVRSADGVPIVAERLLTGGPPWSRSGSSMGPGSTLAATTWLFAAGGVSPATTEQVVVQNLSGRPASVDVTILDGSVHSVPQIRGVEVPGGGRRTIVVDSSRRSSLALEVRSSSPVVVERAIYHSDQVGISVGPGVPLPGGAQYPQPR